MSVISRRSFVRTTAAGIAAIGMPRETLAADPYDVLITGGRVIDPASRLDAVRDVAIARGRIAAVSLIFIGSSNELGALESGLAASWLGTIPSVVAGGIVTLLVVAITVFKAPRLRDLSLDKPDGQTQAREQAQDLVEASEETTDRI